MNVLPAIPVVCLLASQVPAAPGEEAQRLREADELFAAARFAEAQVAYSEVAAVDHGNVRALSRLGTLALLANRLEEASRWLRRAVEAAPDEGAVRSLLALARYRANDFEEAARLYRGLGRHSLAAKLESFGDRRPYRIEGGAESTHVPFLRTDPLPVVKVKVNDSQPVNFIIDTGASEIYLDTEFAEQAGAEQFGTETGEFAAGQQAAFGHGRVDSVALGDFTVRDVPVHILNTRRFAPAAGGERVDGILGTLLLAQFLATLDYPGGRLILRRRTPADLERFAAEAEAAGAIQIPLWMAGDHYMLAWGRVNGGEPMLLFIDTGLAGGGFVAPDSTLQAAGIEVDPRRAVEGVGGGGTVRVVPFLVEELALGEALQRNIVGFAGVFPPGLEDKFGFRVGGLVSHQFFRPYALTFDFERMRLVLEEG